VERAKQEARALAQKRGPGRPHKLALGLMCATRPGPPAKHTQATSASPSKAAAPAGASTSKAATMTAAARAVAKAMTVAARAATASVMLIVARGRHAVV